MSLPPLDSERRVFDNQLFMKAVRQRHTMFRKANPLLARNVQPLRQSKGSLGIRNQIALSSKTSRHQGATAKSSPRAMEVKSELLQASFDSGLTITSMKGKALKRTVRLPSISNFKRIQSLQSASNLTADCLSIKSILSYDKSDPQTNQPPSSHDLPSPRSEVNAESSRVPEVKKDLYAMELVASLKTSTPFRSILDKVDSPKSFNYMLKFDKICLNSRLVSIVHSVKSSAN